MKNIQATFLLAALITTILSAITSYAGDECPSMGFNNGYINFDNTSMTLIRRGEGITCCVHHLKVLCVYEKVEPGAPFYVQEVRILNETQNIFSGYEQIAPLHHLLQAGQ